MKCKHGITEEFCHLCRGGKPTLPDKDTKGVQTLESMFGRSSCSKRWEEFGSDHRVGRGKRRTTIEAEDLKEF